MIILFATQVRFKNYTCRDVIYREESDEWLICKFLIKNGSVSTTNIGLELSNSSLFDLIYWILQLFRIECDSC